MKKVLTIAGSDSSGGAGIQADIKTITVHGMFALCAVTALTAQNTTGVFGVLSADADFVSAQIDTVFADIPPDSVKVGMVSTAPIIEAIAERLTYYKVKTAVVDPVMVSTSGARLLEESALASLQSKLIPAASLITPNIPEAEILSGMAIASRSDMSAAARKIAAFYKGDILIKGGHLSDDASDLLYEGKRDEDIWFPGIRLDSTSTHGTGCTLSSAIACNLAAGMSSREAVARAKRYITEAIRQAPGFGRGHGPLNHLVTI